MRQFFLVGISSAQTPFPSPRVGPPSAQDCRRGEGNKNCSLFSRNLVKRYVGGEKGMNTAMFFEIKDDNTLSSFIGKNNLN